LVVGEVDRLLAVRSRLRRSPYGGIQLYGQKSRCHGTEDAPVWKLFAHARPSRLTASCLGKALTFNFPIEPVAKRLTRRSRKTEIAGSIPIQALQVFKDTTSWTA
jgi:hypothetical protein